MFDTYGSTEELAQSLYERLGIAGWRADGQAWRDLSPAARADFLREVYALASEARTIPALERAGAERRGLLIASLAAADVGVHDPSRYIVGPGTDWCAYAVMEWMCRAGIEVPGPRESARRGARASVLWTGKHGEFVIDVAECRRLAKPSAGTLLWGDAMRRLRPGDVLAWRATKNPLDWRGHVAVVELVHEVEGQPVVRTIGGNEGGMVKRTDLGPRDWFWRRSGGLHAAARPGLVKITT